MNKIERIKEMYGLTKKVHKKFINISKKELKEIRKKLFVISKKPNLTHLLAILLLERNLNAIKTINYLLDREQIDEALVLMRVMLERSALVFTSLKDNLTVEDVEKLQGSKCIKGLKKCFSDIGWLYGLFSEIAHSTPYPSVLFCICNIYDKKKKIKVKTVTELKMIFNIVFCFIVEINFAVIKFLAKEYIKVKSSWKLNNKNCWNYTSTYKTKCNTISQDLLNVFNYYLR